MSYFFQRTFINRVLSWAPKNWCFWTVVLEKTLESPLDCKEIQPVHSKGDRSWVSFGRYDVKAQTVLWPPHAKSWLIGRLWCWEGLGAGEGDDRGDGCMASPTQWTWVWVNPGSWWWTGRPGVLWFMGSQLDTTEPLNWTCSFLKLLWMAVCLSTCILQSAFVIKLAGVDWKEIQGTCRWNWGTDKTAVVHGLKTVIFRPDSSPALSCSFQHTSPAHTLLHKSFGCTGEDVGSSFVCFSPITSVFWFLSSEFVVLIIQILFTNFGGQVLNYSRG